MEDEDVLFDEDDYPRWDEDYNSWWDEEDDEDDDYEDDEDYEDTEDDEEDYITRNRLKEEMKIMGNGDRATQLAEKAATYESLVEENDAIAAKIKEFQAQKGALDAKRTAVFAEVRALLVDGESYVTKKTAYTRLAGALYTGKNIQ